MNKIKRYYFLLKGKRGSIVSALVAAGIMGVSFVTLVGYMRGMSTQTAGVTQTQSISFNIHMGVLSNLRGLLIDTKANQEGVKDTQNQWGVCSLVEPPNKIHGVDLVRINLSSSLSGKAAQSFSKRRWEAFFDKSEYEITSDDGCRSMAPGLATFRSGPFGYCFKYIGKRLETANEVYVLARIVPKKFPDFSEINLSSSQKLDVKLVTFELQVVVGVTSSQNNQMVPMKYYSLAWSNEVVECDVQVRGKWTNVQFAGTGTGRLSERLVVNHPNFGHQLARCSEVEFGEMPSDIIMGGYFSSDSTIAADHSKNKKISCRKNMYRCPGNAGRDTDYFDEVRFKMNVLNNYGGLLSFNNVNLTLLNDSGAEVDSSKNGKIDSLTVEVVGGGQGLFEANTDLDPDLNLQPGVNIFNFSLKDKTSGALVSICKSVCTGNTHYPSVSMGFTHAPSKEACTYSRDYSEPEFHLGCNVCHSKMCHKIGLGTFGPPKDENGLQGLVDEPLDGTIPECALKKATVDYDLPSVSSGTGDCVAMAASSLDSFKNFSSASYQFQSCSTALPVLCFAYGHYLPAMTVTSPGQKPSIVTSNFAGTQEACYKMGRELMEKTKLANYFRRFWPEIMVNGTAASVVTALTNLGLPTLGSNHFDYVNNATRGLFMVPSYNVSTLSNRLSQGSGSYLQKFISSAHSRLWVAMEKDGGSQLIGSIPQATVATSPFSVFTRKGFPSRAVILKDTNNISDSGTDTVLTHNIRYKGVYNASGGSRLVLCRKSAGNFVLASGTSLANAPQACKLLGAAFLPPVSSLEWVKAMDLVSSNDEMYPFPSPGDFPGEDYSHSRSINAPGAWVALTKNGSGSSAKDWRLNKAYFPDSDSIFKTESIPDASDSWIGIIDYKGKPVMPTMDISTFLNLDLSVYKKACFTDEGNDQVALKSSVSASGSCGGGQTEVTKDNLKITSIRFMADWVEENTSGEFIVDGALIQQAVTQAKNTSCKGGCDSAKASCDSGCSSSYSSCTSSCVSYSLVNGVMVPTTDSGCMSSCASAHASCRSSCTSVCGNCKGTCNTTHNTNGHAHRWFPDEPSSCN